MPLPKWLLIAKNEYRLRLNRIRPIRTFFPVLAIGLLAVYVAYIAPFIANMFIDDLLAFFLSQLALAMVPVLFFMIFFYLMILPITYTLQGMQADQVEIFLAAPIKPSDILLGEFLGIMPFYAIFITIIAGFFTAALSPLGLGLSQIFTIVLIFCVVFLSALWIGIVVAAVVRTRFAKSARGKDIGRALSLVVALPIVAIMYAIIGGGFTEALIDPSTNQLTRSILGFLPSSWGADVILGFAANPGNFGFFTFETMIRLLGLVIFFVLALWLGAKLASRIYSVEPTSFNASIVRPDGFFFKTIKILGGKGSSGNLLVSVFKDYTRRLENLSRLVYILGLLALVNIFLVEGSSGPGDALIMGVFLFAFLAVLIVGQVALGGKESVFIHKKAPSGISRLVKARLIQSWLVAVPIGIIVTVISLLQVPQIDLLTFIGYIGLMAQLIAANIVLALGLALLRPEFSENAREQMMGLMVNAQIALFVSIGIFIGSQAILNISFFNTFLLQSTIIWVLGVLFLQLGKTKINNIE
ncbi:hypothetical protein E2P60_01545 [Candidatus Bathyarchaeota archaeon]|nr:hypothetical protein E2P60_01545 [Candidatus Bathyarchaeota archaeon]